MKNKYKIILSEVLLVSSLLFVNENENDQARAEYSRPEYTTQRIYSDLDIESETNSKLVDFDENGDFVIKDETTYKYIAPEGYKIDYINKVGYKDIKVKVEKKNADKILEYKILRNNLMSSANILFYSSMLYYLNEREEDKKQLKM